MDGRLRLRPLRVDDEVRATAVHEAVAVEGHEFLVGRAGFDTFPGYLAWLGDLEAGRGVPDNWVPTTFLAAVVRGDLVGRATIRHRLNPTLESFGGHLGYVVAPDRRRRGHATAILRRALDVAAGLGIDPALLTIDEDNIGSLVVAQRCGAIFAGPAETGAGPPVMRRYWIPTHPGDAAERP